MHKDFKVSASGHLRFNRCIVDATDLETLLDWVTPRILQPSDGTLKDRFRALILKAIHRTADGRLHKDHQTTLSELPIFKEMVPCLEPADGQLLYKTTYSPLTGRVVVLSKVTCVPRIVLIHFFEISTRVDKELFNIMGYQEIQTQDFLTSLVIPWLHCQPEPLMDHLMQLIFRNPTLPPKSLQLLSSISFVTACSKDGGLAEKRLKPCEIIDQTSRLADLYFDDERVFGSGQYSAGGENHNILKLLGMKSDFNTDIAGERIGHYDALNSSNDEMFSKCRVLLEMLNMNWSTVGLKKEWLVQIKLPAIKGGNCILPPSQCRSDTFKPLIDGVLGIVTMRVEPVLQEIFGWNLTLDPVVISSRIDIISSMNSLPIQNELSAVLKYLKYVSKQLGHRFQEYVLKVKSNISSDAWLPGLSDGLWPPDRIFASGAREFEPYISELPSGYWRSYGKILIQIGVSHTPCAKQLVEFISTLQSTEPLSSKSLDAVITALERLRSGFPDFVSSTLLIPDVHQMLVCVTQFIPADRESGQNIQYAHPRVPRTLVYQYGIPQLKDDLAVFQHLNGPDIFEEYCQQEDFVTRISKALSEVSLWSTFNEFVANAEDCGSASQISWILESENAQYPSKDIFCDELRAWQTPALYIYNDGVFSDADFKALVKIGVGNEGCSSKIGKYGIGSLTMYLFTDIPSMISGPYFIMFDPSRRYLPLDSLRRRRVGGLRLSLTQMRSRFKDHLEPFVGIGSYNLGTKLRYVWR